MATGEGSAPPQYVLLGHLTRDRIGKVERWGGTALYAGVTALRLGYRVGIVTAVSPDFELPVTLQAATLARVPSEQSTTYELLETGQGRTLRLCGRAKELTTAAIPQAFRAASVVHLAPVTAEVPPTAGDLFPAALVGATPQGWLRTTDLGVIATQPDRLTSLPLERFGAVVLSAEDVRGDLELVHHAATKIPMLVLTRGAQGNTLYVDGRNVDIPPFPAHEVDPTGAGDVFAAAFFIRLHESRDPLEAARFASCTAAIAVEGDGVEAIPDRAQVEERLRSERSIS
jgi:sugar/nucleoside kinase (ribokinase family)